MSVNPNIHAAVFAKVESGYSGSVQITANSVTAVTNALPRESAASLLARAAVNATRLTGAGVVFWVDAAKRFNLAATSEIGVHTSTSDLRTKLGLTTSLAGSATYTFPNAIPNALTPLYGAQLRSAGVERLRGPVLSAGGYGATNGIKPARAVVEMYDTHTECKAIADQLDNGGVYDVLVTRTSAIERWAFVRFIVRTVSVNRWDRAGNQARVVIAGEVVKQ